MFRSALACLVAMLLTPFASAWADVLFDAKPAVLLPPAASVAAKSDAADEAEARLYSDTFLPLREDVRAFERDPGNRYTYCIRNVATYECLSYSSDGSLRKRQYHKTAHGTGFAYKLDGDDTRLLTNEHVVSWPFVTDTEHRLEDVPLGCKLLTQKLHIVDNEDDEFEADDIPLTRVVDDRALDVAVVRAKGKLRLMPYRVGRSSALSTGDVVIVRGFPLGVFAAYNTGKVINTLDEDRFQHWDHADFIVDAQLSSGNSGSPVLALNRKTGEYELVGVFHASYSRASSLNAVIAIEQVRELMFELKPRPRAPVALVAGQQVTEQELRRQLFAALADPGFVPYIGLGSLLVRIHPIGEGLLFEIFSKQFPLSDQRVAFLLDTPVTDSWGRLQKVWFGNDRGYLAYSPAELESESIGALRRTLQRLYALASSTLSYRKLMSRVPDSQEVIQKRAALQRSLARTATQDSDVAQQLVELTTDKAPATTEAALRLADVMAQLAPHASPAVTPTAVANTERR